MTRVVWITIGALAASQAAAQALACDKGPGIPLGVLEYSCASCTSTRPAGQQRSYVFGTEPVVVERASGSPFEAGDAVVAVDNHAIKSAEGAAAFAYPKPGPVLVQLRRLDGKNARLLYTLVTVARDCEFEAATPPSATVPTIVLSDSTVDGRLITDDYTIELGFKIVCMSSCTEAITDDGHRYWIYRDPPALAGVDTKLQAYPIGFRDGDLVTAVNGMSILEPKGEIKLSAPNSGERLTFDLVRDGKPKTLRISYPRVDGPSGTACKAPLVVVVRNDSGHAVDIYADVGGSRGQYIGSVQSGRAEFPQVSTGPNQRARYFASLSNPNERIGINDMQRVTVSLGCPT